MTRLMIVGSSSLGRCTISQRYLSLASCLAHTQSHVSSRNIADVEQFAKESHPGGAGPIHRAAGRDATGIYMPLHPPGTIENELGGESYMGTVDRDTLPKVVSKAESGEKVEKRG